MRIKIKKKKSGLVIKRKINTVTIPEMSKSNRKVLYIKEIPSLNILRPNFILFKRYVYWLDYIYDLKHHINEDAKTLKDRALFRIKSFKEV